MPRPRLASFTELVATTIANADSRAGVTRLAADQAALRRVATLVARGVPPEEVFAAVVEEVGRLLPVDFADLGRCEPDGTITFVAGWGKTRAVFPVGARLRLGGKNATTLVAQTGGPVRVESYADASGEIGGPTSQTGVRSAVGTPVTVDGRLWGVMAAGWSLEEPMPADTVPRLAQFTDLLETAIANAESRAALARVANEQAALRRVATLVAHGVLPEEVFAAVAEEIGRLLAVDMATMSRFESDRTMTVLANWGSGREHFPVGSNWPLSGRNLATLVYETGRPGRLEPYVLVSGPLGLKARKSGVDSAVGTPLVVEDRLYGAVVVASTTGKPLPPDTEERLTSFTELVGDRAGERREPRRADGLAGADRGGGRRGAPARRPRSARWRAAASRPHDRHAQDGLRSAGARTGRPSTIWSAKRSTTRRTRTSNCVSSPTGSFRRSWSAAG